MWPGDPIFDWIATAPESLLKVDLRQYIPTFILASSDYKVMVGDLNLPRTTAIWVGASVAVVLLFSWAMFRAGAFRWPVVPGLRRRGLAAVAVGALAVVAAGWWGMNAEFFQPVTTLTPVQTWRLQEGIKTPRGITLREGKAYITDYDGPTVAELDLATGAYRLIQPVGSSGTMTYTHPGDVQFGPDGLFYVLNNGTGNDALYAMTLDGQVQRRIALDDKADISVGLRFTQDGEMLVTDMRRGVLLWYGPEGGTPRLGSAGEAQRSFNNLNGITLDGDGNIYAFEGSGFRVQVLDRRGVFMRDYKLTCQPVYGAVRDGWLDVTCERGLISINLETGRAQPAWIANSPVQNQYMVGMTYGPDGTLYVVQQEGLVAYRVQH
jgi:outer membrane protein assembly factor BamB